MIGCLKCQDSAIIQFRDVFESNFGLFCSVSTKITVKKLVILTEKYCKNSTVKMLIGKLPATLSYTVECRVKDSLFLGKRCILCNFTVQCVCGFE